MKEAYDFKKLKSNSEQPSQQSGRRVVLKSISDSDQAAVSPEATVTPWRPAVWLHVGTTQGQSQVTESQVNDKLHHNTALTSQ